MFQTELVGQYVLFKEGSYAAASRSFGKVIGAYEQEDGRIAYQISDLFSGKIYTHTNSDSYSRIIRCVTFRLPDDTGGKVVSTPDRILYVMLSENELVHSPSTYATNINGNSYYYMGAKCASSEKLFDLVQKHGSEKEKMDAIFDLGAA